MDNTTKNARWLKVIVVAELAFILLSIGIGIGWFYHPGAGLAASGLVLWLDTLAGFARK